MKKNHNIIILIIISIIVIIISTTGIFKKKKIDNNFNNDLHAETKKINNNFNNDLHAETKKILEKLDDKIYVNIYLNGKISPKCKELQSATIDLLNKFKLYSNKEVDFSLVEIEELQSDNPKSIYSPFTDLNIYPIFITEKVEIFKVYPYATVHYKEKTLPLPIVLLPPSISEFFSMRNDTINELTSEELTNAIDQLEYNFIETIYLLQQEKRKKIAFLQGNGELDSLFTWDIRNTLSKYYDINHFDITTFSSEQITSNLIKEKINEINQYTVIVIARPTITFQSIDQLIIDQYIMNGGRVIWLIDGTTAHMNNFNGNNLFELTKNDIGYNILLEKYGIKVNHDLIQDQVCTNTPVISPYGTLLAKWVYNPLIKSNHNHLITIEVDSILTHFVSSIDVINKNKTNILLSSSNNSNILNSGEDVNLEIIKSESNKFSGEKVMAVLIEDKFKSIFENIPYLKIDNEIILCKEFLKESKENKMIVISDGDIIKNGYIHQNNRYLPLGHDPFKSNPKASNIYEGNTDFILNSIQYLCDDESLIKIRKIK